VAVFGNSPAEVAWVFRWCREHDVPVHISIFEPGFLRLTLAHLRAGTLPRRSKIQLYFGGEAALFGLPARRSSVEVLLDLLDGTRLPWMAGVLWGDVIGSGLAEFAIRRGGHVRVGLEDYAGPGQPTNEELVDRVAQLGRSLGRKPVDPEDAPGVLWGA
jgi:3-keto-5-aminohexanoate cleavage enzyme